MFAISDSIETICAVSLHDMEYMDTIVKTLRYGMYDEIAVQALIFNINKLLSVGHTREKGLQVLFHIIPDCSMNILLEYSIPWTKHVLNYHPKEAVSTRRFQILCLILDLCHNNQDYNKFIVTNILPKIIEMCLSVHNRSKECQFSLECIYKCLQYFPTTMIVYKKKIETFLIALMDTPLTSCVLEQAAKCMLYLNQTGGSGSLGSMHIKNYRDYVCKLTNTLDKLYDSLYETTNEYSEHERYHSVVYEFRNIPPYLGDSEKLRIVERRMKSVATFITKAIELSYPVKKTIKPEMLLSVIQRGLAVHVHIEENLKNVILSTVIHNHQIYLLQLIKTCITCFKENFIRFSTIKMLMDYLQRTQNCKCFKGRSEYKIAIYEIFEYWILNCSEFLDPTTYDKIMKHIISDITPIKNSLVLHVKEKTTKDNQSDNALPLRLQLENENICYQALKTLHVLLQKVLLTIKDNTCTVLFKTLIKNLFDISVDLHYNPYTNKNNRLMLYKVLIAIFDQQRKSLDMALAVNILNIGLSKFDVDIVNVCAEGLMALEKICQPTHLSLSLNILEDGSDDNQKSSEKRKRSEFNEERSQMDKLRENGVDNVVEIEDEEKDKNYFNKNDENCEKTEDISTTNNTELITDKKETSEDEDTECIIIDDSVTDEETSKNKDDLKDAEDSNTKHLTEEDDEESVGNEDIDLQLQDSDKCEEAEESPTKKIKFNEDEEDEEEIDVIGEDVEDMLSSFVDEVKE